MSEQPVIVDRKPIEVSASELPLACPTPQMSLWNAHPRVYLAFNREGIASCPYCGNRFHLSGKAGHG